MHKHRCIYVRNLDTSFEIFSCPYLFVFVKDSKKKFTLIEYLQYVLDIPKFWRYLIGLFPLKAFPNSHPYLYSSTRPKPVYSVAVISSPPVKKQFFLRQISCTNNNIWRQPIIVTLMTVIPLYCYYHPIQTHVQSDNSSLIYFSC
jgi:hypothetical protein